MNETKTADAAAQVAQAAADAANSGLGEFFGMNIPPSTASTIAIVLLAMAGLLWLLMVLACLMIFSIKGQAKRLASAAEGITDSMQHVVKWQEYVGTKEEEVCNQLTTMQKMLEERSSAARKQSQAQAVQIGKLIHQQTDQLTELLRR